MFARAIAVEFRDKGIRCNAICPGTVESPSLRDRIAALSAIQGAQGVNPRTVEEADVFAIVEEAGQFCIEAFFFRAFQNWGNAAYYPRADRSLPLVAELLAAEPEWGADDCERPVVLVAHGGLIAALTAALLDLPVDNWPVLGGMGNASWTQLSGHGPAEATLADVRWRLDVWNASAQVANDVL